MTDSQSLDGIRHILLVKNANTPYVPTGPLTPGTEVLCLRANSFGVYAPCVARIVKASLKRITVDLWSDSSERVTVSRKAILWRIADTEN